MNARISHAPRKIRPLTRVRTPKRGIHPQTCERTNPTKYRGLLNKQIDVGQNLPSPNWQMLDTQHFELARRPANMIIYFRISCSMRAREEAKIQESRAWLYTARLQPKDMKTHCFVPAQKMVARLGTPKGQEWLFVLVALESFASCILVSLRCPFKPCDRSQVWVLRGSGKIIQYPLAASLKDNPYRLFRTQMRPVATAKGPNEII